MKEIEIEAEKGNAGRNDRTLWNESALRSIVQSAGEGVLYLIDLESQLIKIRNSHDNVGAYGRTTIVQNTKKYIAATEYATTILKQKSTQ